MTESMTQEIDLRKSTKHNTLYRRWRDMISRCHNTKVKGYENYGGRGICVCDEWRASFEAYATYVGNPPTAKHQIDRINNDGNYEPGNVRWATPSENCFNNRRTCYVTWNGKEYTFLELAKETGIPYRRLKRRVAIGWTVEDAVAAGTTDHRFEGEFNSGRRKRKFTDDQVRQMRSEIIAGLGQRKVARNHGCSLATLLLKGQTYKDVK